MSKTLELIHKEKVRQQNQLQMIPSENYASKNVLEAVGSVVINKYSEGQPKQRYYQGNEFIDQIELHAKDLALQAFDLDETIWEANVQAVSGSYANLAVYNALIEAGDKMLSMSLPHGGHLSHGWKLPDGKNVSFTSKIYESEFYTVAESTKMFSYDAIEQHAKKFQPKIIISGGTAYPREIDYERMSYIAKKVGAYYLADVAHEAGLIAGKTCNSPFEHADIVTMTTRKTLRGPIGAIIFARKEHISKINKAVFPGLQGGPMNHNIAGIAVALEEALQPEFKTYTKQVVKNAQHLANELVKAGLDVITGGTDKHLLLIDLRNKEMDGWTAAWALEYAGIICNRNTVPFDTASPFYPSGLRLGTPAITTRGMKEEEMELIAQWINDVINHIKKYMSNGLIDEDRKIRIEARKTFVTNVSNDTFLKDTAENVLKLCERFPIF